MDTSGVLVSGRRHLANTAQREIASQGGQASSGSFEPGSERAREAGRKGGSRTGTGGGDDAE
jgi:general stress protein YciG